jgi:hypothetical protein
MNIYNNTMKSGLFGLLLVSAIATSFDAQGMEQAAKVFGSISKAAGNKTNQLQAECSLLLGTVNGLALKQFCGKASETSLPFFYRIFRNTRFVGWTAEKGVKGFVSMATAGSLVNEVAFRVWDIGFLQLANLGFQLIGNGHNSFLGTIAKDFATEVKSTVWSNGDELQPDLNEDGKFNKDKPLTADFYEAGINLTSRATLTAILFGTGFMTNPATLAFVMATPLVGKVGYIGLKLIRMRHSVHHKTETKKEDEND